MCDGKREMAIVLNWNGAENTLRCVDHLVAQRGASPNILVIDNGSTDEGSGQLAAALPKQCRLVRTSENRGFAGGMNLGLELAKREGYEFAWLLNNDAFAEPDCLSEMLNAVVGAPEAMIATPKIVGVDGEEQHAGATVDWSSGRHEPLFSDDLKAGAKPGDWLTGTAMLVRVAGLERIGLFDERYFAYWEDVDLSTRVLREGGQLISVPGAVVTHLETGSLKGGWRSPWYVYLNTRNAWLFLTKFLPRRARRAARLRFVTRSLEEAGSLAVSGREDLVAAKLAAVRDALRGRWGKPGQIAFPRTAARLLTAHPWFVSRMVRRVFGRLDAPQRNEKSDFAAV